MRRNASVSGQYFDAETELFQNWHRFYDASIGRYLEPDPAMFSPEYFLVTRSLESTKPAFGYADNNPIADIDSTGLLPDGPDSLVKRWEAINNAGGPGSYLGLLGRAQAAQLSNALSLGPPGAIGQGRNTAEAKIVDLIKNGQLDEAEALLSDETSGGVFDNQFASTARARIQELRSISNQVQKVEQQLAQHGKRSLERSLKSLEQQAAKAREQIRTYGDQGGYTSSVERELRAFENEIKAIKYVLERGQ